MSFFADNGRILIEDENGDIVFDTDERLLVFTDFVSGQHVTPQRRAFSQNSNRTTVNVNVDTVVASINPAANVIFGAFKAAIEGFPLPVDSGWFQATGTYLTARFVTNGGVSWPPPPNGNIGGHVLYTFRAESGQLIFNERTFISVPLSQGSALFENVMPPCTIDFKLFCGAFV